MKKRILKMCITTFCHSPPFQSKQHLQNQIRWSVPALRLLIVATATGMKHRRSLCLVLQMWLGSKAELVKLPTTKSRRPGHQLGAWFWHPLRPVHITNVLVATSRSQLRGCKAPPEPALVTPTTTATDATISATPRPLPPAADEAFTSQL